MLASNLQLHFLFICDFGFFFKKSSINIFHSPSTSSSFRVKTQPVKVLEIPTYRKNQINQNPTAIVTPSPPRISEIPPFKPRKSNESNEFIQESHQSIHLPHGAGPDWARRLKNTEPAVIHRSVDCIAHKVQLNLFKSNYSIPKVFSSFLFL